MKKNLGRVLILFFLLSAVLQASTYTWNLELNKKNVVTNEAVYFKYECVFSDKSELYVIEFNPVTENEQYAIKLLSEQENIVDNHRVNSFEFVLYVKKGGKFSLNLEAKMKKTNKDSIENTVLGRDNAVYEEYSIKKEQLQAIELNVEDVNKTIVGNFSLQTKQSEQKLTAYEPYHLEIIVQGEGDLYKIKPYEFMIKGVKVFTEEPQLEVKLTKEGYKGIWSQKFAFVSQNDFVIPKVSLEYFDINEHNVKILNSEQLEITVKKAAFTKSELLDEVDEKKFSFKIEYLYYLLTFIAGFLVAKIKIKRDKKEGKKESHLCEKISQIKSLKELNVVLVLEDEKRYKEIIEKIETNQFKDVSEVKKLICG
ncbi:BatD family protein [Sulfurimonas marina]|uniref:Protein BatD n=1 Tax=Sulfurimonas marina TaxID=2590551 RepID=A0A7M1AW82_9BACT|nr:BatD family protein [Sulfurimonas marina]QOP41680.1 protein BatD [Sulfurimonas marina]